MLLGFEIRGRERVPKTGSLLVVANHQSFLDPPCIGHRFPRYVTFLARASLFNNPVFGWLIRSMNSLPIKDGEGDVRAIRVVLDRLSKDECVLIFPEGARSFDGLKQPFREGAALIARRAKCAVLPVAIEGAFDAWPRTRKLPSLFRGHAVQVEIGDPIPASELTNAREITSRLEREVLALRSQAAARLRERTGGRRPIVAEDTAPGS